MFIDKQKIEREYLDEITKIGNLFDTLNIPYFVGGDFALLANNFKVNPNKLEIFSLNKNKSKILEVFFKLGYVVFAISDNKIKAKKLSSGGDLFFEVTLGDLNGGKYKFEYNGNTFLLNKTVFEKERGEVISYSKGKGIRGYYKFLSPEEIYLLKMNSNKESDLIDLDMIKSSGKLELEKLLDLLKLNGMI